MLLVMGATGAEVGVKTGGRVGIAFIEVTGTVIEGAEVADVIAVRFVGWKSSFSSRLRFREPPVEISPLSGCGGSEYGDSPLRGMYQLGCDWGRKSVVGDGNLEDGDCDCTRGGDTRSMAGDSTGSIEAWLK